MHLSKELIFKLKISRPILWIPEIFLFILGFLLAQKTLNLEFAYILFILTFPINYIMYGINDYFDYNTDKLNKRKNGIEGAILNPKKNKNILYEFLIIAILILIIAFFVTSLIAFSIIALLIIFGYIYSAPPIRTKTIPIIDSISCGLGYFLIFLLGFSSTTNIFPDIKITTTILFFLISYHAYTSILDHIPDKKANLTTIATFLGKRFTISFTIALLVILLLINSYNIILKSIFILSVISSSITLLKPTNEMIKTNVIFIMLIFMIYTAYYIISKLI